MTIKEYGSLLEKDREKMHNHITLREVFEDSFRKIARELQKKKLSEIDRIEWEDELARRLYWFNKFDSEDLDVYSLEEIYEILKKEKEWKTNG